MYYKRIIAGIGLLAVLCVTGCGKMDGIIEKNPKSEKDSYSKSELTDGIYIQAGENKYYKPNTKNQTFNDVVTSANPDRVIYSTNNNKYIPTLYKGEKLVFISSSEIPNTITAEKFQANKSSVGIIGMSKGTNGEMTIVFSNIANTSDAYKQLSTIMTQKGTAILKTVNDKNISKKDCTKANSYRNRSGAKELDLGIYIGTHYHAMKVKADTEFWYSKNVSSLEKIELTKNGYAIIGDYLPNGYYDIQGCGLIRIDKSKERP